MPKRRSMVAGTAVASVPLALGLLGSAIQPSPGRATTTSRAVRARAASAKSFAVPMTNLQKWAGTVLVTLDNVSVDGRSAVHKLDNDCEMHFGAHTDAFQGTPDGLVLEPMNVCVQPAPGKTEQSDADWNELGDQVVGAAVAATGVPRIWPEHLEGGSASNPDHAVELHPLTTLKLADKTFDFAPNVFAGQYRGGVGEETALAIAQNTSVSVTRNGGMVGVSFRGGRIGNFTIVQMTIDRASIEGDGAGSFRMNGDVIVDESSGVPVRIVTAKGTAINEAVAKMRSGSKDVLDVEGLVLFSLSPESLLEAANKSTGGHAVAVDRPLQLILYGTPDDR